MDLRILAFETRYSNGKPSDWVHLTNRGAFGESGNLSHSTWHRVAWLVPPESDDNEGKVQHMRAIWSAVGPAYEAWKAGNEIPEHGVPLSAWAGVTPAQVDVLKSFTIRTVEDVAAISDAIVGKIPLPDVRDLRKRAEAWLGSRGSEQMARELDDLRAKYEASLEMLEAMKAEQPKRGPGRPPKSEAA